MRHRARSTLSGPGRFWADALGWEATPEPAGFDYLHPSALVIDLVPVQDSKVDKNRVHLDFASHFA